MSPIPDQHRTSPEANARKIPERFLTTPETSAYLRLSVGTCANRRSLGLPPSYHRSGGRIVYALSDLEHFMAAGRVEAGA